MNNTKVNYNEISASYDDRYKEDQWAKIRNELNYLISRNNYKNILEVGCGTGYWLDAINIKGVIKVGLDYSIGMLKEAYRANRCKNLVNADANNLPFINSKFDFIFCMNALHHFQNKKKFILDIEKYLSPGGTISIIGVDPRCENDEWYIYDYFDSTYEDDLKRFPAWEDIENWMMQAGLENVSSKIINEVENDKIGKEVLRDAWLQKGGTSQLSKLSAEKYDEGYKKVLDDLEKDAEKIFKVRITFKGITGKKKV
ncbi:MAG: methyltransferase domain-containing protein [Ignavibacteriae bacterium]|nr:methyltransferase domain-containing protein [Ignavibacteriota bacterium]